MDQGTSASNRWSKVSLAGYKGYEILNQDGEKVDSKPGILEKKADCIEAKDSLVRIWITEDNKEERKYITTKIDLIE